MRGHLTPAARGVAFRRHRLEQLLVGRHAEREGQRAVAVVEEGPVRARAEVPGERDLHGLVARAGDLEEDPILALELDLLVIDAARREHRRVEAYERVAVQARVALGRPGSLRLRRHDSPRCEASPGAGRGAGPRASGPVIRTTAAPGPERY